MGTDQDVPAAQSRWYALYLRSRYEQKVHTQLLRKGVEAFLPLAEEVHVWSDRKKKVKAPLFPGYIFVKTDLSNRLSIVQADGVVRFVSIRGHPSPIPDNQIEWIRVVTGHPEQVRREAYLSLGKRVRVVAGPFKGIEGLIVEVKGSTRVVIALEAIAQAISVDVAPEFVEAIEKETLARSNGA